MKRASGRGWGAALGAAPWRRAQTAITALAGAAFIFFPILGFSQNADATGDFLASFEQTVAVSAPASSAFALSYGSGSTLGISASASGGNLSLNGSAALSLQYGTEASTSWYALAADEDRRIGVLSSPEFDVILPAPDWLLTLSIGEASLAWSAGPIKLEAGKTIVNWGVGKAFSPADFFADFDYTGALPARRSSFIARASVYPGPASRLELAAEPFSLSESTYAARFYSALGDILAVGIEAGYKFIRASGARFLLGAFEVSFDLPGVSPYAEASASIDLSDSSNLDYKILGGGMSRIGSMTLIAEYQYDSSAVRTHRAYANLGYSLDQWTAISIPFSLSLPDSSIGTGLSLGVSDLGGFDLSVSTLAARGASGAWTLSFKASAKTYF